MFCGNCGREIADNSTSCIYCGETQTVRTAVPKPFNINAVLAISFGLGALVWPICYVAIIPAIAGIICGCIGLSHAKKYDSGKRGLALTGLISGSIIAAIYLILIIIGFISAFV